MLSKPLDRRKNKDKEISQVYRYKYSSINEGRQQGRDVGRVMERQPLTIMTPYAVHRSSLGGNLKCIMKLSSNTSQKKLQKKLLHANIFTSFLHSHRRSHSSYFSPTRKDVYLHAKVSFIHSLDLLLTKLLQEKKTEDDSYLLLQFYLYFYEFYILLFFLQ